MARMKHVKMIGSGDVRGTRVASPLMYTDIALRPRPLPRAASLYVAAVDSSTNSKLGASICDGVDDDVEIQQAIDALTSSGGGTVFLSEGTFTIGSQIHLDSEPVNIVGAGKGSTIITCKASLNADMILIGQADNQGTILGHIQHLTIDGNGANQTSGSGIKQQSGNNLLIDDVEVKNCKEHGIYITAVNGTYRSDRTTISGGWIHLNLKHGIFCENPSNSHNLIGVFCSDNGVVTQAWDNIYIDNANETGIVGCMVWQGARHNITLSGGGPNHIVGCTLNSPQRSNINLTGGTGGCTVSANTFHDCSVEGVGLYPHIILGVANSNVIVGNWFNDTAGTTPSNIFTESGASNHNLITGNVVDAGAGVHTYTVVGAQTRVYNNTYMVNNITLSSATFTIDAVGNKVLTIAHNMDQTPAKKDCWLTVLEETADVDDWGYNLLKVDTVDATNVVARINVSVASATVGATARLGLIVQG